jgi:hypothetical protein
VTALLLDDEMGKVGETAEPGVENQDELRKTIETGITGNALEEAL